MVDVCLIVEGTYPYVSGGVSSWIHGLISDNGDDLPTTLGEYTFSIYYIGAHPGIPREYRYKLPPNVVSIHETFLNDPKLTESTSTHTQSPATWELFKDFHSALALGNRDNLERFFPALQSEGFAELTFADIYANPEAWQIIIDLYKQTAPEQSFVDFFWVLRATYLSLFAMLQSPIPPARIYHTVCTGYSGLLASLAHIRTGSPMLITEHGLYTREREIEIAQTSESSGKGYRLRLQRDFFQQWWLNLFEFMERMTYTCANRIIGITDRNYQYEISKGADPARTMVIPNGVDINRWNAEHEPRDQSGRRISIGFVGRVVPIKDVKTFLRAIHLVRQEIPDVNGLIIGPTDEDPDYYEECSRLVETLHLESNITFTGPTDVRKYYQIVDVVVLTSLSEGQPLVVLESNCAGVPVVMTNVGSADELINGRTAEDRAIGPSGLVTALSSPAETAAAILAICQNDALWEQMSRSGQERVRRFYRQRDIYSRYRAIYDELKSEEVTIKKTVAQGNYVHKG
jgi:glycosyltransferase involved in cell wall biosynthesis